MPPVTDSPPRRRFLLLLAALALGIGLAAVGYFLWAKFNPFVNHDRAVQEVTALRDAARRGPLTDAQFGRVLELAGSSRQPIVTQSVIAVLELEAKRTPDRTEPARVALSALETHPDAGVRTAATAALARLATTK